MRLTNNYMVYSFLQVKWQIFAKNDKLVGLWKDAKKNEFRL